MAQELARRSTVHAQKQPEGENAREKTFKSQIAGGLSRNIPCAAIIHFTERAHEVREPQKLAMQELPVRGAWQTILTMG